MSASRTLRRGLTADKDRRSALPKPGSPRSAFRRCTPPDSGMLRFASRMVYRHYTKGPRTRRVP